MISFLDYYSREEIQEAILESSELKEVAVMIGDKGFGKRPEVLQYKSDVLELVKQGATSFHISEEHWKNPLLLSTGMTKKQLNDLRAGWDLILDVDSDNLEHSKVIADLLVKALKFHNLSNISVKFSGGTGIHILIPFESFPEKVNNIETRLLFPEAPKVISEYIKILIKPFLSEKILSISTLNDISKTLNIPTKELKINNEFNPFKIVELDSQLISSRHMFRLCYSINEKSNLVSIPIDTDKIRYFKPSQAKMQNVEVNLKFLEPEKSVQGEANQLFMQAFDSIQKKQEIKITKTQNYEIPKIAIKEDFFPECIKKMLLGMKEDGRKRAVFVLISFLQHMGWSYELIQTRLLEWNKLNYEPLREGYIISQVSWFKKQQNKILPPNCGNESYYKSLGIGCFNCKYKNPVNYVKVKLKEVSNKHDNQR